MFLLLGDLPAELVPILAAVLVVGILAFLAHPSRLRDRLRPVGPASLTMLGMLALAAIPLLVYGFNQIAIYRASGPGDEHWEFGHWIIMAVYAFAVLPIAAIAGLRVSGWRSPAWTAGLMVALLGLALGAARRAVAAVDAVGDRRHRVGCGVHRHRGGRRPPQRQRRDSGERAHVRLSRH
jgi:hypothetical protein